MPHARVTYPYWHHTGMFFLLHRSPKSTALPSSILASADFIALGGFAQTTKFGRARHLNAGRKVRRLSLFTLYSMEQSLAPYVSISAISPNVWEQFESKMARFSACASWRICTHQVSRVCGTPIYQTSWVFPQSKSDARVKWFKSRISDCFPSRRKKKRES